MKPIRFSWPDGKSGAFTTSWDDATIHDRRLVDILNRYGIKATWNLNSQRFGLTAREIFRETISEQEVTRLYSGHEVAVHAATHAWLWRLPDEAIFSELIEDRRNLERLTGHPVQGMAFPFGGPDDQRVRRALVRVGMLYSRSIASTDGFELPDDFLYWRPTCHQNADLQKIWERFVGWEMPDKLFYLWGHSFEFEDNRNWDKIEKFCSTIAGHSDVWFATNMEIYQYVTASRSLQCSVELTSLRNPSAIPVWIHTEEGLRRIDPGQVIRN